jgi:hypothetical protein
MTASDDNKIIHDLEDQARSLQQLIDEAQRLQREIDRHLRSIRRQTMPYRPYRGPDRRGSPR